MIKWFENYSSLSSEQYSIFLNIINIQRNNLTVFYEMNEVLDKNSGEYEYKDEDMELKFYYDDEQYYVLETSFGSISLDYYAYKTIISKVIDIYSETYPLGTVVDIYTEQLEDIVELEEDSIRLVILDRFVPFTDELFFYYTGVIYPIGNTGETINSIHFSPSMVKKVVHMGYSDDYETEYIKAMKEKLLFDDGMHSTTITTSEELERIIEHSVVQE
jgi:hypothetical protein